MEGINPLRFSEETSHLSPMDDEENDSKTNLRNPSRRSFFRGLASLALLRGSKRPKEDAETVYGFLTPECEIRMSVQHFENSEGKDFRFRDRLTNRGFCLAADGNEDRSCSLRFTGSIAIAIYHFSPRFAASAPVRLRERVVTIDHDARMAPRPPFERDLTIERDMASDIQAFGYNKDDPGWMETSAQSKGVWSLLHQDLYLNDACAPFLIVHWKHTLDLISLVDIIPGEETLVLNP